MKKEQKDRMCMMDDPIRSSGAVQSLREGWGVCHSRRKLTDWEKRRSGDTGLQASSTINHAICKAFCHVFNLYTTVLFTDYARLYVAKPDLDAGPMLIP